MNQGILLILLSQCFAAAHKLFARISRNASIDDIDRSAKPGRASCISARQIKDQICFEEHREVGILLGRTEPLRINDHFIVAALEIAEAKAPASVGIDLIDNAA